MLCIKKNLANVTLNIHLQLQEKKRNNGYIFKKKIEIYISEMQPEQIMGVVQSGHHPILAPYSEPC